MKLKYAKSYSSAESKLTYLLWDSSWGLLIFLILAILVAAAIRQITLHEEGLTPKAEAAELLSPVPTLTITPTPTATPTPTPVQDEVQDEVQAPTQKEIEAYIKTIFGKDAKIAIAVSRNECSPHNAQYPRCQFKTSKENSIGIFQINIESATTKVHFYRIPGKTLEEKIEWLKDPFNNTLMAYWIFKNSNWYPWTAYTSGNYLKDM